MKWIKEGLVFKVSGRPAWQKRHTFAPSAICLSEDVIRVYVGFCDEGGTCRIGSVDLCADDPRKVKGVSERPVLDVGRAGTFDDHGVFPSSVARVGDKIYLYYTGFQRGVKIRYTMFGGLAISSDNGKTFARASEAPVTDRSPEGLYTRGGPDVLFEDNMFKLWYSSGSQWEEVGGKLRPCYDIYYLESNDGVHCPSEGHLCLKYDRDTEHGLGRPQVIKEGNTYHMFHTIRTKDMKYSMGYAMSRDGRTWERRDKELGLAHSSSGWDSEMIYFPWVLKNKDAFYMFYTGNNFGEKGFGLARLVSW